MDYLYDLTMKGAGNTISPADVFDYTDSHKMAWVFNMLYENCEVSGNPTIHLAEFYACQSGYWEDFEEDMTEISINFPTVTFEVEVRSCEDAEDWFIYRFRRGKMEVKPVKITKPTFED